MEKETRKKTVRFQKFTVSYHFHSDLRSAKTYIQYFFSRLFGVSRDHCKNVAGVYNAVL